MVGVLVVRRRARAPGRRHLSEGCSPCSLPQRRPELLAGGSPPASALGAVRSDSVFTIHTPVSAGNERFDADLVRRVAGPLLDGDGRPNTGGVPVDRVLTIGLGPDGDASQFDMTAFSLRLTRSANAVSHSLSARPNPVRRSSR